MGIFFKPTVLDDRRRRVAFRDPIVHGTELDRATRDRVNEPCRRWNRWIGPLLGLSVLLQLPLWLNRSLEGALWTLGFAIVFAAIIFVFVVLPLRRVVWARSWKDRYTRLGLCPACQYDLRNLEPGTDGCSACPECGGAWRMPAQVAARSL